MFPVRAKGETSGNVSSFTGLWSSGPDHGVDQVWRLQGLFLFVADVAQSELKESALQSTRIYVKTKS